MNWMGGTLQRGRRSRGGQNATRKEHFAKLRMQPATSHTGGHTEDLEIFGKLVTVPQDRASAGTSKLKHASQSNLAKVYKRRKNDGTVGSRASSAGTDHSVRSSSPTRHIRPGEFKEGGKYAELELLERRRERLLAKNDWLNTTRTFELPKTKFTFNRDDGFGKRRRVPRSQRPQPLIRRRDRLDSPFDTRRCLRNNKHKTNSDDIRVRIGGQSSAAAWSSSPFASAFEKRCSASRSRTDSMLLDGEFEDDGWTHKDSVPGFVLSSRSGHKSSQYSRPRMYSISTSASDNRAETEMHAVLHHPVPRPNFAHSATQVSELIGGSTAAELGLDSPVVPASQIEAIDEWQLLMEAQTRNGLASEHSTISQGDRKCIDSISPGVSVMIQQAMKARQPVPSPPCRPISISSDASSSQTSRSSSSVNAVHSVVQTIHNADTAVKPGTKKVTSNATRELHQGTQAAAPELQADATKLVEAEPAAAPSLNLKDMFKISSWTNPRTIFKPPQCVLPPCIPHTASTALTPAKAASLQVSKLRPRKEDPDASWKKFVLSSPPKPSPTPPRKKTDLQKVRAQAKIHEPKAPTAYSQIANTRSSDTDSSYLFQAPLFQEASSVPARHHETSPDIKPLHVNSWSRASRDPDKTPLFRDTLSTEMDCHAMDLHAEAFQVTCSSPYSRRPNHGSNSISSLQASIDDLRRILDRSSSCDAPTSLAVAANSTNDEQSAPIPASVPIVTSPCDGGSNDSVIAQASIAPAVTSPSICRQRTFFTKPKMYAGLTQGQGGGHIEDVEDDIEDD